MSKGNGLITLDRAGLLAALARPVVKVEVPELEGTVYMREMSVRERRDFQKMWFGDETKKANFTNQDFAIGLVARTICDADGVLLFSESDAETLWDMSEVKLGLLLEQAQRINGIGAAAADDAEKNSEPITKSTSASSSRKRSATPSTD